MIFVPRRGNNNAIVVRLHGTTVDDNASFRIRCADKAQTRTVENQISFVVTAFLYILTVHALELDGPCGERRSSWVRLVGGFRLCLSVLPRKDQYRAMAAGVVILERYQPGSGRLG
jgi:hypothetical protein